jgi:hypothetical protein
MHDLQSIMGTLSRKICKFRYWQLRPKAIAINKENFRYWKRAPYAIVVTNVSESFGTAIQKDKRKFIKCRIVKNTMGKVQD